MPNNRKWLDIFSKPEWKNFVQILKNTNLDHQWIEFEKNLFGFEKDLFTCLYSDSSNSGFQAGLNNLYC